MSYTESSFSPPASAPSPASESTAPALSENAIDEALVRRFIANDEAAFVEIVNRYRGKIFTVAFRLLRNHADAEEVTQDTFIRAHRALANFRSDSALSTWLYRIAVNLSRNRYWYFFRRRRHDSFSLDSPLYDGNTATFSDLIADSGQDPSQEAATREFSALVERCMEQLDERHREVLTHRNILNRSYDEIAVILGINVGTVKSRIARARESLRERLADTCPELDTSKGPGTWFLSAKTNTGPAVVACS